MRHSYEVKVSRVVPNRIGKDGRPMVEPVRGSFDRAEGPNVDAALAAAKAIVEPLKLRLRSVNVSEQEKIGKRYRGTIVVVLDERPAASGQDQVKRSHLARGLPPEAMKQ